MSEPGVLPAPLETRPASDRSPEPLLRATGLSKRFATGDGEIEVLRDFDFEVAPGESVAVLGYSGVGKSTLLYILGALDHPTSGQVFFRGEELFSKSPEELGHFRNHSLGFVFQFHHLLPEFDARENVMMPGLVRGIRRDEMADRATAMLESVGLGGRLGHKVGKLSGGERQRVAVARALVLDPPLVLADEPTGNLDPETGARIEDLLVAMNRERGASLVAVTHNERFAAKLSRTVTLRPVGV